MGRLQLVELADLPRCPQILRDCLTDFLSAAGSDPRLYADLVPLLRKAMEATGETHIVDLCSGVGGPLRTIVALLESSEGYPVSASATDLHPNARGVESFEAKSDPDAPTRIRYITEPVDATRSIPELRGFRMIHNAFHHFPREVARSVLAAAVEQRSGIAVYEILERTPLSLLATALGVVRLLFMTPWLEPFRWERLLWTYLIPVLPLMTLWDGLVSCLRVYSPAELRQLISELPAGAEEYCWQVGKLRLLGLPIHATYLIGIPGSTRTGAAPIA